MVKGNFGQIAAKWTWGLLPNLMGNLVAHGYNISRNVHEVTHLEGATAIGTIRDSGAFALGYYLNGPKGFKADWKDHFVSLPILWTMNTPTFKKLNIKNKILLASVIEYAKVRMHGASGEINRYKIFILISVKAILLSHIGNRIAHKKILHPENPVKPL